MSLIGDALEAMHFAQQRVRAVSAVIHEWADEEVWRKSAERWEEIRPEAEGSSVSLAFDTVPPERPRYVDQTYRIWRRQPGWFWRIEAGGLDDPRLYILSEGAFWLRQSGGEWSTNVTADRRRPSGGFSFGGERFLAMLFDPSDLLRTVLISDAESASVLGRPAYRLAAIGRSDIQLRRHDWHYATRHVFVVDAELGVVLRYEAWLDSDLYMIWEFREVHFHEELPDDLFLGPDDVFATEALPDPQADALVQEIQELMERRLREFGKPPDA